MRFGGFTPDKTLKEQIVQKAQNQMETAQQFLNVTGGTKPDGSFNVLSLPQSTQQDMAAPRVNPYMASYNASNASTLSMGTTVQPVTGQAVENAANEVKNSKFMENFKISAVTAWLKKNWYVPVGFAFVVIAILLGRRKKQKTSSTKSKRGGFRRY